MERTYPIEYFAERIHYFGVDDLLTDANLPWATEFFLLYSIVCAVALTISRAERGLAEDLITGDDIYYPHWQLDQFVKDKIEPTRPDIARAVRKALPQLPEEAELIFQRL
jgi:hypothetical protein